MYLCAGKRKETGSLRIHRYLNSHTHTHTHKHTSAPGWVGCWECRYQGPAGRAPPKAPKIKVTLFLGHNFAGFKFVPEWEGGGKKKKQQVLKTKRNNSTERLMPRVGGVRAPFKTKEERRRRRRSTPQVCPGGEV